MADSARSLRILIIEDNKDFAWILSSLLKLMGHCVFTTDNGIEGLDKINESKPDVIFCDIGLPGMNGYEVVKSIRKDSSLKELPVIAMTGYASDYDIDAAIECGFTQHLSKPVDISTLKNIIAQLS